MLCVGELIDTSRCVGVTQSRACDNIFKASTTSDNVTNFSPREQRQLYLSNNRFATTIFSDHGPATTISSDMPWHYQRVVFSPPILYLASVLQVKLSSCCGGGAQGPSHTHTQHSHTAYRQHSQHTRTLIHNTHNKLVHSYTTLYPSLLTEPSKPVK